MDRPRQASLRDRMIALVRAGMELLVLGMVCLSPWLYGAVDARFEFFLFAGVSVLLLLWGVRTLLEWRLTWKRCPVTLCLAALFLLGILQLTPLPPEMLPRLSPGAARLHALLLPDKTEELAFDKPRLAPIQPAGQTISLYPFASRRELTRVLAILVLFAAVRNNLLPSAGLRRLSRVAIINGGLLSLFGIVQFLTTAPNMVYWTFATKGSVFGPFINKNHFAFYINLCIGLGVGLLLSKYRGRPVARDPRTGYHYNPGHSTEPARSVGDSEPPLGWAGRANLGGLSRLLNRPDIIWLSVMLAIMVSAVALSLSRGGVLALVGATLCCFALRLAASPHRLRLGGALLVGGGALALVLWLGLDRVEQRLATLWQGDVLREDRWTLFSNAIPLVREYPIWGTGFGTFNYVEPIYRTSSAAGSFRYEHAHNDYLEALIEGGVVRLLLSLAAIALVFRSGLRAYRRHQNNWVGGLAMGALFAFTTLVIHSLTDFGIHLPAVAVLAAVMCAYLIGLDSVPSSVQARPEKERTARDPGEISMRFLGLGPLAGAGLAAAVALLLYAEGVAAKDA